MGFFARVDAVGLEKTGRVCIVGNPLEQEWHQGRLVLACHRRKQLGKLRGVGSTVIGWHLHANQQHPRTSLLRGPHHDPEVVASHRQREPAQGVIAAQLDDHMTWVVLGQQCSKARAPARGRIPTDAGVDHGSAGEFLCQAFLEQGHPASTAAQTVFGAQRVAYHQNSLRNFAFDWGLGRRRQGGRTGCALCHGRNRTCPHDQGCRGGRDKVSS